MEDRQPSGRKYRSKTTLAREALTAAIMNGDYSSGQRFNVRQLADDLDMSITPIREALRFLEAEGMVVYDEHRSISAVELSEADATEIYALRSLLEGMVTEWSVENSSDEDLAAITRAHENMLNAVQSGADAAAHGCNREWHFAIYQSSGSTLAMEFIAKLWIRYEWNSIWQVPGRLEKSLAEHEGITNAILRRDAEMAGRLMREHVGGGHMAVRDYWVLKKDPNTDGTGFLK
jgi:DNA-binding GntR family transcriptional regulator